MWLFDCGLDNYEWQRTIVVLSSAIAPFILAIYLIYKKQMKKWVTYTLISSFLIAAFGWEIWINFGLFDGDPVNLRRSTALSCALPINVNWLINSFADTGIVWLGIILVTWVYRYNSKPFNQFKWLAFSILFGWFMTQNILVETIIYYNQVGGGALLSWAPLMPFGPWWNPIILSFGERDVTFQSQSAWLIATPIFYKISIYFHTKTNGK